jgi:hypothetical protein
MGGVGRAGRPAGCGAGGSPARGRGAPVQEGGKAISVDQLKRARDKHVPKPNFTIADDKKITELFEKGFAPAAVAAVLAGVPGVSAKRVESRWNKVLKPLRQKKNPHKDYRTRVAAPRWTPAEREELAVAAAIVAARPLHDEHCTAAGAPSAMWSTVADLMRTRRSDRAIEVQFHTCVADGRMCVSNTCDAPALFGLRHCEAHQPPVSCTNNTSALNACAAQAAQVARAQGLLPTRRAEIRPVCTDLDVIAVISDVDKRLRAQQPTPTSGGTFVPVRLASEAAASGERPTMTAAHSPPPTMTLAVVFPLAQPGTQKSFLTNVVRLANQQNVFVILEGEVRNSSQFVAVLPQTRDARGNVGNYLLAGVVELGAVNDGLERAVEVLSAHSFLSSKPVHKAFYGFKLRENFKVGKGDNCKCRPPRTPCACGALHAGRC